MTLNYTTTPRLLSLLFGWITTIQLKRLEKQTQKSNLTN